jgi:hypothetical protein
MANSIDRDNSDEGGAEQPESAEDLTRSGGRPITIDSSPEGDLMQIRSISSPDDDPLATADTEAAADDIDERAAQDARMAVRRREHSAD